MKKFLKKIIKFIIYLTIFLIFDFVLIEVLCYCQQTARTIKSFGEIAQYPFKKNYFDINKAEKEFRKPCGLNYKKAPILIYGSSYTYGFKLKDNEHIGFFLSKITKRPVYNFGLERIGIQHILYLMQNQKLIKPEPEFVILIYTDDLARRMFIPCSNIDKEIFFKYEEKNNNFVLKKDKIPFITNSLFYRTIQSEYLYKKISQKERFNELKLYLNEMKKAVNQKYPKAKFIFITYDRKITKELELTNDFLYDIKLLGIDIISFDDIFGEDLYKKENRLKEVYNHPSSDAWKKIAPVIAKTEKM